MTAQTNFSLITTQIQQLARLAPRISPTDYLDQFEKIVIQAEHQPKALCTCQELLKVSCAQLHKELSLLQGKGRALLYLLKTPPSAPEAFLSSFPTGDIHRFLGSLETLKAPIQLAKMQKIFAHFVRLNSTISFSTDNLCTLIRGVESLAKALKEKQDTADFVVKAYRERRAFSAKVAQAREIFTTAKNTNYSTSLFNTLEESRKTYTAALAYKTKGFAKRQGKLLEMFPQIGHLPTKKVLQEERQAVVNYQTILSLFETTCQRVKSGRYDLIADTDLVYIKTSGIELSMLHLAILENLNFVIGRSFSTNVQEENLERRLKELERIFAHLPNAKTSNYQSILSLLKQMRAYKNIELALQGGRLDLISEEDRTILQGVDQGAILQNIDARIAEIRRQQAPEVALINIPPPEPHIVAPPPAPVIQEEPAALALEDVEREESDLDEEEPVALPQNPPQPLQPATSSSQPGFLTRLGTWFSNLWDSICIWLFGPPIEANSVAPENIDPFGENYEIR